jgi:transposase
MIQWLCERRGLCMTMKQAKSSKLFWLDGLQWPILEKHLPKKKTGPKRKDDRRIISGIIHMLQSGCRWQDCPPEYGPSTTVYNRFHRWAKRGIWESAFNGLTSIVGTHYENSIGSTIVKAHRSASGKKGAVRKPSAGAGAGARRRSTRPRTKKAAR